MSARCVRPDCDLPAAARLAADFSERVGWLCDLEHETSPHDYPLCARHADALTLPINWELHDQRSGRIRSMPVAPAPPAQPPVVEAPQPAEEPLTAAADEEVPPAPEPEPVAAEAAPRSFEYDPATEVDESTPLLSRAFRAAASGGERH